MSELPLIHGRQPSGWKMLIYGVPGVGKSSLAAKAPAPVFLDLESGLRYIDCTKTPQRIVTLNGLDWWLKQLQDHDCKTVVIDTVDEMERLIGQKVIEEYNANLRDRSKHVKMPSEIPYGRGGDLLAKAWEEWVARFEDLVASGKNVLLVGHEQIFNFKNPTGEDFQYYSVNLDKKAANYLTGKMDAVLFAKYETRVKEKESSDKYIAAASGARVLHTANGAAWTAKSRFALDDVEPLSAAVFDKIAKEQANGVL